MREEATIRHTPGFGDRGRFCLSFARGFSSSESSESRIKGFAFFLGDAEVEAEGFARGLSSWESSESGMKSFGFFLGGAEAEAEGFAKLDVRELRGTEDVDALRDGISRFCFLFFACRCLESK